MILTHPDLLNYAYNFPNIGLGLGRGDSQALAAWCYLPMDVF